MNPGEGSRELTLSNSAKNLMSIFGLKYPIFQAAPGGETLAAAVAKAGAMGALPLTWITPEEAFQQVSRLNTIAKGNFYGNYVLHFEAKTLDKALEAGLSIVQFSLGIPTKEMVAKIRTANARLGIQVANKANAKTALDLNPDFLICQGVEAGGHVQASDPLLFSLKDVVEEAKQVPVLAAGGITTGHDIRNAIKAGAAGVVLGSRLIATKESEIHDEYKNAIVEAGENDTVVTTCFSEGWFAQHRALKNKTFLEWQAAGCPLAGNRPGENDVLATAPDGSLVKRYNCFSPRKGWNGSIRDLALFAGQGVEKIKDIPSVADLLRRLWEEYEDE